MDVRTQNPADAVVDEPAVDAASTDLTGLPAEPAGPEPGRPGPLPAQLSYNPAPAELIPVPSRAEWDALNWQQTEDKHLRLRLQEQERQRRLATQRQTDLSALTGYIKTETGDGNLRPVVVACLTAAVGLITELAETAVRWDVPNRFREPLSGLAEQGNPEKVWNLSRKFDETEALLAAARQVWVRNENRALEAHGYSD